MEIEMNSLTDFSGNNSTNDMKLENVVIANTTKN